ncbi:MAG: 50S ribosomal protein L6 [Candidatus Colwellbacteria bacterium RBG_13_48_8]|uniref:50S ribosomal protein L6 n=1 Tax=Candidatus Colwellbacteria bacterium RBG_13_48_8 TaxID=1797685 RepID=A0A1G1YXQ4_9BACT|nr:MAG: 50S ribosomal protein L6 [Candidatus Colwellbacteria bacterium RBG_13_48_8]
MRALVQNAVEGSKKNFSKSLSIEGVGYRANLEGNTLILSLGFSHPIRFMVPEGIKVEVNGNSVKISGADRAQVGEVAAKIRGFKKPEPYKGKGIRYEGEIVRKKAGKKAVSSS